MIRHRTPGGEGAWSTRELRWAMRALRDGTPREEVCAHLETHWPALYRVLRRTYGFSLRAEGLAYRPGPKPGWPRRRS